VIVSILSHLTHPLGLVAIGYDVKVVHTICDFWEVMTGPTKINFDIIITDYDGLGTAENIGDFPAHHCKYYIVDGFGTQPSHNTARQLDLKRVLTPYPYDLTNTAINMITDQLPADDWSPKRSPQGVIWAKSFSYLSSSSVLASLKDISALASLHTTYGLSASSDPYRDLSFLYSHPIMDRKSFLQLLSSSRFLLGVGKPLDGPTALEAMAHGCAFINPIFNPPIRIPDKPTDRPYTSQHVFVEQYIPRPFAYTVDIANTSALKEVIKEILKTPA
jgi:hypothetical protein